MSNENIILLGLNNSIEFPLVPHPKIIMWGVKRRLRAGIGRPIETRL